MDEDNCDDETYFLCAQSAGASVDFLACMDAASGSAASKAQGCASKGKLDWNSISTCFKGDDGQKLKKAAALYFDKKFPNPVGVPHIEINGEAQNVRTEDALLKALCATGIQAGACKKTIVV